MTKGRIFRAIWGITTLVTAQLAFTITANASTAFSPPAEFDVGILGQSIASADFNNDGHLDLATAHANSSYVTVLYGNGSGQFAGRLDVPMPAGQSGIATGDFNNDHHPDIAVIGLNSGGFVVLNDNLGGFSGPIGFSTPLSVMSITAGDLNHDGNADLAIGSQGANGAILFGNGTGSFPTQRGILSNLPPTSSTVRPWAAAIADFNEDGNPDLITGNYLFDRFNDRPYDTTLLLGNGGGGFSVPQAVGGASDAGVNTDIAVADINHDGHMDFVTSSTSHLVAGLGHGDGTFTSSIIGPYSGGGTQTDFGITDYNHDGNPDIVFVNTGFDEIDLLDGHGDGSFTLDNTINHSFRPRGITFGDFNEDNQSDLATVSLANPNFRTDPSKAEVYTNLGSSPIVGDIQVAPNPVQINSAANATATFTDSPTDTHTAVWDWGDGATSNGIVLEADGSGSASGSHPYTAPGVYTVTLTVTDNTNLSSTQTYQYVSVYDPNPKAVFSAGTKYTSPPGAFTGDSTITGSVKFGLSYQYQGTVAVDKKQFTLDFNAANLTFNATTVSSLVIAGDVATLRGTGTINGAGTYNFLVVGDQSSNTIRVQIKSSTGTTIYDTQPSAADTAAPITPVQGSVKTK